VAHEVAPLGAVRFQIEFYRIGGAAADVAAPTLPSNGRG
jgi:hypothetical protein